MLKDIKSGSRGSKPSDLTAIGDRLYFTAADGRHGREPWISDGTSIGTRMIKNISPGSYSSGPRDYTLVGDRVFFTAQDGNGRELWVTDGTAAGTSRVKDIRARRQKLQAVSAHGGRRHSVLHRGRRPDRHRALEERRHRRWHGPCSRPRTGSSWIRSDRIDGLSECRLFRGELPGGRQRRWPVLQGALRKRRDGRRHATRRLIGTAIEVLQPGDLVTAGSLLYFAGLDASWKPRLLRTDGTALGTKTLSPVMHADAADRRRGDALLHRVSGVGR